MKELSIIPTNTIRNHQTNSSTSKTAHQFSKTPRFRGPNPECKIAYYCFDSQLSKRKAGFGYGEKSDFTKPETASPASTKYNLKSFCEQNANKGKTIGHSREKMPDRSYLVPQMQKVPGPGQYQNQFKTRMSESFTIRPQTIDVLQTRKTYKKNPGPGAYVEIDLEPKNGRFTVSKFSDSKYSIINKSPRFRTPKDSPGPSNYRQGDSMHAGAKYTLSVHKGNGTRAFSKSQRLTFINESKTKSKKTPGPGNYELPTEFGTYGDAKYYKALNSTIS